ncbi:hypothetical protein L2E82_30395 [Cichorium intybus]|uniref:Uncharacterized protein n=1 Tax=Cichorium intybus TaxID=13427 RepID=A0ACB9D0D9_CICIN|nr:hypothetical protein L2E82_30395 [Cichorium intybus]
MPHLGESISFLSLQNPKQPPSLADDDEDGAQNHEDLEDGDEEEDDKGSKHIDKEDEPRLTITWTEDDQKNLMDLRTSEMEWNRRLEKLIAKRRERLKT